MVSTLLPLLLSTAYFGDMDPRLSPALMASSNPLIDQNFGYGLTPEMLLTRGRYALPPSAAVRLMYPSGSMNPLDHHRRRHEPSNSYWNELMRLHRDRVAGDNEAASNDVDNSNGNGNGNDEKEFKILLDVRHFKPEEIEVSVDEARRYLLVRARHEEKSDEHGLVSREFARRYALPERVLIERVKSGISADGVLTLAAPLRPKQLADNGGVRKIEIKLTGKPARQQQSEQQQQQKEEEKEKPKAEGDDEEITITTTEIDVDPVQQPTTTTTAEPSISENEILHDEPATASEN